MSFYNGARAVAGPIFRFVFGIKSSGIENIPKEGPLVVCSNHRSNYDPVIIGSALPCELKFMAKAELFKIPLFSGLLRMLGAFPVSRGKHDTEAVKKSIRVLKSGKVLLMFPEGHRQKKGDTLQNFKSGAVLFAYKAHAPIIPVAIVTKGTVRPFKRNKVLIGKPMRYEDMGFTDGSMENLHAASSILRDKIAELISADK
jgi:1-acyl-sn-glycerol-3-phosphate acyltransferase